MAITSNPEKVPQKKITSMDVTGFAGGLYLLGEQNAEGNQFVEGQDIELSTDGFITPRRSLQRWLPDTVETCYEIFPALIDGVVTYFVADDGKIKWCVDGDNEWTDAGGDNTITTQNGGKTSFLRVLDNLLILNGGNGDKLARLELATKEVFKYALVADPASAPTATRTGLTTGDSKIYYGYTYSSPTGETKLSPILTYDINKNRSNWLDDGSEYLTITRPDFGSEPAGATYWNLYVALAASGGTIEDSDMLMLAPGLDINQKSITDNATLAIDIGRGNPPPVNSTDGPRVQHGIETNGRPVLFGDVDSPYNIWIGGDGEYALDFSSANGGFRAEVSKGTNYYPSSVIGFRNGQGIPSLTILFSNTQGLSKQATLEQNTINFGNQSFTIWGVTEQNYGAAGVASSVGVVNYKGQLSFPSTDGFTSMDTQPQLQNVISTQEIDKDIKPAVRRIKSSALPEIVGTAWDNRVLWLVPADGFDTPNQIWIRDLNNNGAWYRLRIRAQWIGTVSPPDSPPFVYICQGKKILKMFEAFGTVDYTGGVASTFSTSARGPLMGMNDAHNSYQALVQAMFYVMNLMGDIRIGVNYRDLNGRIKTKSKLYSGPQYARSSSGGWSDPQYVYAHMPAPAGWSAISQISAEAATFEREDVRIPLSINDLAVEAQWWIETPDGYCDYMLRAVSFQGESLGIKPDLR